MGVHFLYKYADMTMASTPSTHTHTSKHPRLCCKPHSYYSGNYDSFQEARAMAALTVGRQVELQGKREAKLKETIATMVGGTHNGTLERAGQTQ